MANHLDPLVVGRVIGEVVDPFVPTVRMLVYYGSKHVNNGYNIKPSIAIDPPTIHITGEQCHLFTLVMVDPDAPSPSNPTMRERLHWVVVNIPGGTDPSKGNEIVPYEGPQPPLGIHRFVLALFQQRELFPLLPPPPTRANFNTRIFSRTFDLGPPAATMFFNSQREPASKKRAGTTPAA